MRPHRASPASGPRRSADCADGRRPLGHGRPRRGVSPGGLQVHGGCRDCRSRARRRRRCARRPHTTRHRTGRRCGGAGSASTANYPDEDEWAEIWALARQLDPGRVADIMRGAELTAGEIFVRTLSGTYRSLDEALLPGPIVPADGTRDAESTIDTDHHSHELALLGELGAVGGPTPGRGSRDESWWPKYKQGCVREYLSSLRTGQKPQASYLDFRRPADRAARAARRPKSRGRGAVHRSRSRRRRRPRPRGR